MDKDHFPIIKQSNSSEDITLLKVHASNSLKIHKIKIDRIERRKRFYSYRFPYHSLSILLENKWQIIRKDLEDLHDTIN